MFSRIQNLHISQTNGDEELLNTSLVEFKIYISLKQFILMLISLGSLVEFKIYISLKHLDFCIPQVKCLVEFKIYISLKQFIFFRLYSVV